MKGLLRPRPPRLGEVSKPREDSDPLAIGEPPRPLDDNGERPGDGDRLCGKEVNGLDIFGAILPE